jgi:16S rRNA (guanine527-N7)-methyltransferase
LNGKEIQLLRSKALDYGIELSESHLNLFQIYLDELWDWNRRMNLTGLSTREKVAIELFLDSLIPAPFLLEKGRVLDVGSGAGFPGIPLKIIKPQLKVQLLEANSKKVSFLKQVIRLLNLKEIEVINGRIEKEESNLPPGHYHLITARALSRFGQTVAWCTPFLAPGGLLVGFLGRSADDELKESRQIMEEQQVILHKMIPYFLPGKKFKRNTVLLKKKAC